MAFNATDLKKLQPISSANDDVALAQEDDFGDESKTDLTPKVVGADGTESGGDYYKQKLLVTEMDIQRARDLIDFMYRTGHAARTKRISGPETVQNGMSFLFATEGSALILQNITQDLEPTERWMRQATSTEVPIVRNQDLSGGSLTLETSAAGPISPAFAMTVNLTGATLTTAGTPGTIRIRGTDEDNLALDVTLSFANTALGAPQTTTEKFKTVTSVAASGFSAGTAFVGYVIVMTASGPANVVTNATDLDVTQSGSLSVTDNLEGTENPVRLTVTPKAGSARADGNLRATVTIHGTDKWGRTFAERLSFKGTGVPKPQKTKRFFYTIAGATAAGWKMGSKVDITSQDTAVEVTFKPQDTDLRLFLTAAINKGPLPFIYNSLVANGFNLASTRSEVLSATIAMMGRRGRPREDFNGLRGVQAKAHDLSALNPVEALIYAGYQVKTTVEGVIVPFIDQTLSITQNLAYSGIQAGTAYEEMRPYRSAKRDVMIDGSIQMTRENNLVDAFVENDTFEDVRFSIEHNDLGSFGWLAECILDTAQLGTDADPASPNFDRYAQPCNIVAFDDTSGEPADFRWVVTYADYEDGRPRRFAA